jgi:tetratricopeptide (TPR) repeat protein
MKNLTFNALASLLVVALLVSGCNPLKKMQKKAALVSYEMVPQVLETNGGKVEYQIKATFPPKYFNKKVVLSFVPVYKYDGGEKAFDSVFYQGEAVTENYGAAVNYTTGGQVSFTKKFPYEDQLMRGQMEVKVKAFLKNKSGKSLEFPIPPTLGNGIIATSTLVAINPRTATVSDNYVRVSTETKESDILFEISSAKLRPAELKKSSLKDFNAYVKATVADSSRKKLKGVTVSSYASPDGSVELNTGLSSNRGSVAQKYMADNFKKEKLAKATASDFLSVISTPEDWDGFKKLMEASNIPDKDLILRVLTMYSDPEVREKEIKNISKAYEEIAETILPKLRRSKLIANVDLIGLSDEQIVSFATSGNLDTLSIEQLLRAGSLVSDNNKKIEIYSKAVAKYPEDWRAKNSLGVCYFNEGKYADAKSSFEAAKAIASNPTVNNNLGACALMNNNIAEAKELFSAAKATGGDIADYNLGIIAIIEGQYQDAVELFGGAEEYNAGLAKFLNKKYDAALITLNNVKDDNAYVYYLKAVIGARTEKEDLLFNNLRTAVGKNPKLKAYAKKDVEFLKYFDNSTFKSIIE